MYILTSIDKKSVQVPIPRSSSRLFPGPQKVSSRHFPGIPQPLQRNQYCTIYHHKLGLPLLEHHKKWSHRISALLCLGSLAQHNVFCDSGLLMTHRQFIPFYCCEVLHCMNSQGFSALLLKNIQAVPVWGSFSEVFLICSFDLQSSLPWRQSRPGSAGFPEKPCFLYENRTCFKCKKGAVVS